MNCELATADISDYIEGFYNRTRPYRYFGRVSPEVFEASTRRKASVHRALGTQGLIDWKIELEDAASA
jgi:hypothetical protein